MAAETIGFAVQPEDKPELERLVDKYGAGNRSEFLRVAMRVMAAQERAEQLDELGQSFAATDIERWGRPLTEDENTALTRLGYKGPARGVDAKREADSLAARMRAGEAVDLDAEVDALLGRS